jgi:hypothetical protein
MTTDTSTELARMPKGEKILGIYYLTFYRILSVAAVFALWEVAGRYPISPAFPTFTATMYALFQLIIDGRMAAALFETLKPLALGVGV